MVEWEPVFPFLKAKISYVLSPDKKISALIVVYIDEKAYRDVFCLTLSVSPAWESGYEV